MFATLIFCSAFSQRKIKSFKESVVYTSAISGFILFFADGMIVLLITYVSVSESYFSTISA